MKFPRFSWNSPKRWSANRKKRFCFLVIASVTLFLSSTGAYAPAQRASEIQRLSVSAEDPIEFVGIWPYGRCEASAIDSAGNIALIGNGETLQVLDISNPSSPWKKGEVRLEGSPQDIALSGNLAYIATQSFLTIVDISNRNAPRVTASFYMGGTILQSVAFHANHVFVAANNGLNVFDVSDPDRPLYRGTYQRSGLQLLDVVLWGTKAVCLYAHWTFPETASWTYGVDVIDISNPLALVRAGTFELDKGDIPSGIAVSADGHAYVCQYDERDKVGTLTIIDFATDPGNPSETGRYVKSGGNFEGIAIAGNLAYLGQNWPNRLMAVDISNPRSPAFVGDCAADGECWDITCAGSLVGVSHAGGGFSLYRVANPGYPSRLGNFDTPDMVFEGNGITVRGNYLYMNGGSDGLRVMNVSDPAHPVNVGENKWSLSGGLAVSKNFAFGVAKGWLRIYDLSLPSNPILAADLAIPYDDPRFEQFGYCGIAVRPPYAYVSGTKRTADDARTTLTIVDISDPFHPSLRSSWDCAGYARHFGTIALSGHYLYLPVEDYSLGANDRRFGLRVIDVSDPGDPKEVSNWMSTIKGSYASHVVVKDNKAFVTGDILRIFDLSNPASPSPIVFYGLRCESIALSGDYAYLAWDKLWAIDITNLYGPSTQAYYYKGEWGKGVAVSGNIVYVPGSLYVLKNNMVPAVSITAPSGSATLLGSVTIDVQTSHSSGIDRVEFYIDGSLIAADSSAPYAYPWDTTLEEDGRHIIRAQAYNNNGKSSDTEIEVFTRLVYAPLNVKAEKKLNRSLSQSEYINVLSWQAHPNNVNIAKYKLFQVEGTTPRLLIELSADKLKYWHQKVRTDQAYTYVLVAVNNTNRESDPVYITVQK